MFSETLQAAKMFWTDWGNDLIRKADVTGLNQQTVISLGLVFPRGIAVDTVNQKVYWTDNGTDTIERSNLDGSNNQIMVSGLSNPIGLVLDVGGNKIYWTDITSKKIQKSNLDGSGVQDVLTGLNQPWGLDIDFTNSKLYFTDALNNTISRCNFDGSGVELLINTGLSFPRDIALDVVGNKMYWAEDGSDKIRSADLNGNSITDVVTGLADPFGLTIDVDADKLYWTELTGDRIASSDLNGNNVTTLVSTGPTSAPNSIALDLSIASQPSEGPLSPGEYVPYDTPSGVGVLYNAGAVAVHVSMSDGGLANQLDTLSIETDVAGDVHLIATDQLTGASGILISGTQAVALTLQTGLDIADIGTIWANGLSFLDGVDPGNNASVQAANSDVFGSITLLETGSTIDEISITDPNSGAGSGVISSNINVDGTLTTLQVDGFAQGIWDLETSVDGNWNVGGAFAAQVNMALSVAPTSHMTFDSMTGGFISQSGDWQGAMTISQGNLAGTITLNQGNYSGNIDVLQGNLSGQLHLLSGDLSGSINVPNGTIDQIILNDGRINSFVTITSGGLINSISCSGDIAGDIHAGGGLNSLISIDGNLTSEAQVVSGGTVSLIDLDSNLTDPNNAGAFEADVSVVGDVVLIEIGSDFSGSLQATHHISSLLVGGDIVSSAMVKADSDLDRQGDINIIVAGGSIDIDASAENINAIQSGALGSGATITGSIVANQKVSLVDAGSETMLATVMAKDAVTASPLLAVIDSDVKYLIESDAEPNDAHFDLTFYGNSNSADIVMNILNGSDYELELRTVNMADNSINDAPFDLNQFSFDPNTTSRDLSLLTVEGSIVQSLIIDNGSGGSIGALVVQENLLASTSDTIQVDFIELISTSQIGGIEATAALVDQVVETSNNQDPLTSPADGSFRIPVSSINNTFAFVANETAITFIESNLAECEYTAAVDKEVTLTISNGLPERGVQRLVPSQYATIQAAIDASSDDDIVIIAPGTYTGTGNRDIDFQGKKIIVRSEDPDDPLIMNSTVIDCNGSVVNNHRGFIFNNAESNSSVLSGLTIRDGFSDFGGGILCENSSPTISFCQIENCLATNNGGGLYGSNTSQPAISFSLFKNNTASFFGGGLSLWSASQIRLQNVALVGNQAKFGGGIYATESGLVLSNVTVTKNMGDISSSRGGGLFALDANIAIDNSIFWNNQAPFGHEIALNGATTTLEINYSDIQGSENQIDNIGGANIMWGLGNIDQDPLFVDPNNDLRCQSQGLRWDPDFFGAGNGGWVSDAQTSRCIDAGNPGKSLKDEVLDIPADPLNLIGVNIRLNMGVYGGTDQASLAPGQLIDPIGWSLLEDLTNDGHVNINDIAGFSESWLANTLCLPGDINRNGLVDMYDLVDISQAWFNTTSWAH